MKDEQRIVNSKILHKYAIIVKHVGEDKFISNGFFNDSLVDYTFSIEHAKFFKSKKAAKIFANKFLKFNKEIRFVEVCISMNVGE